MQVEIVSNFAGEEFKVIKRNRVNWVLEDSKGVRWNYKALGLKHVRWEEAKEEPINQLIRIGAVVKVKEDAPIRQNTKFVKDAHKRFVIIGFGKNPGDFSIIELGGNMRNSYWGIPGSQLDIA